MKKYYYFILLVVLAFSSHLHSQNSKMEKVINTCKEIDSKIAEEGEYRNFIMIHSINFESNVRAIGKQNTNIKFYYKQPGDSVVEKSNETQFIDLYKSPIKIIIEYNIAASQKININYYLNESGNLIYYHYISKGAYGNEDKEYYFEGKQFLLFEIKKSSDSSDKVEVQYKDFVESGITTKDEEALCLSIIQKADDYKKLFEQIIYAEKIDK